MAPRAEERCDKSACSGGEADKEIDFWKKKSHDHYERWFSLNKQYEGWFGKVMRCERAERELRHQKYKRCLAMAEWCKESLRLMRTYEVTDDYWNLEPGHDAEYFRKKGDFYKKWRKRWLGIAKTFNPYDSTDRKVKGK